MSERLPMIFLSHSHADNAYCDEIYRALTARHFDVWYDNQSLPSGGDLSKEIQRELEARPVLVPLLSPDAVQSYWVNLEIDSFRALVARDQSRRIIPIIIRQCEVPLFLRGIKYINATNQAVQAVVEEVVRSLAPQPAQPAPPVLQVTPAVANAAFQAYVADIERHLALGNATEHTHRPALVNLLKQLAPAYDVTNEPKRSDFGAPDLVVGVGTGYGPLTIGYVEAKDIGKSLDEAEKSEQLQRYLRSLENLVLTNYLEFRWYKNGQIRQTAHLASRDARGKLYLDASGVANVTALLGEFMSQRAAQITSPRNLAERMARLAHMIRDIIVQAFAAADDPRQAHKPELRELTELYQTLQRTLIPDLKADSFADMFAQTIAYGLFAARYNHGGETPFSRMAAAQEIPRTNPFLKRLFRVIDHAEDDAPYVGFVDDLAQMLAQTDMAAVLRNFGTHKKTEDPIVHFYETFLTAYDPKLRELRGVYYTPEPVVSYIVRSVDALLRDRFGCVDGLADRAMTSYVTQDQQGTHNHESPRVLILDPACGTGTFLYYVIDFIRDQFQRAGNAGMWRGYISRYVLERIFGFELLMAPYAMAHLKLGMQLAALDLPDDQRQAWAYPFERDERLGIYLTNTLGDAATQSETLGAGFVIDEAGEGARLKKEKPVMVILGNPPYSGHSANQGKWISRLLRGEEILQGDKGEDLVVAKTDNYFMVDGQPLRERNPKWLNDDYVKFLRFAQWRIARNGEGVVAFITNHGYLDNPTFRGMRQSLMQTFDEIYVLDLHGNSKKKERSPDGGADQNVFDIQQGVAIGIFVKRRQQQTGMSAPLGMAGQVSAPPNSIGQVPIPPEGMSASGGAGILPAQKPPATVHHAHLYGVRNSKYEWLLANDIRTTNWTTLAPHAPFYLFAPLDINLQAEYEQGWIITDILPTNGWGIATRKDYLLVDFSREAIINRFEDIRRLSVQDAISKYDIQDSPHWDFATAKAQLSKDTAAQVRSVLFRPFDKRFLYYEKCMIERGDHRFELMSNMFQPNLCLITVRRSETGTSEHFYCTDDISVLHSTSSKEGNFVFPLYLYPDPTRPALMEAGPPSTAPGGRRPNLAPAFIKAMEQRLGMRFVPDGRHVGQTRMSAPLGKFLGRRMSSTISTPSSTRRNIASAMPSSSRSISRACR